MANPADESRGRRWLAVPACAVAVAAAVLIGFWVGGARTSQSPIIAGTPHRATVEASEGAHFTHSARESDEIVRLRRGRVTVKVAKLQAGERFRVVTSDAEVEARGTSFDVNVVDDRLRTVVVHTGVVEVRPTS